MIFCIKAQLYYKNWKTFILLKKIELSLANIKIINKKLVNDFKIGYIKGVAGLLLPLIYFCLRFVPMLNKS